MKKSIGVGLILAVAASVAVVGVAGAWGPAPYGGGYYQGYQQGYQQGYATGYNQGYPAGYGQTYYYCPWCAPYNSYAYYAPGYSMPYNYTVVPSYAPPAPPVYYAPYYNSGYYAYYYPPAPIKTDSHHHHNKH